jgi:hypothetical protein
MIYKEITKCRICGNQNLQPIIDLGSMALTGIFPKPGELVASAPLEIVKCWDEGRGNCCGLVQLKHTCDLEQLYGDNYGYRSGLNSSMVEHLKGLVKEIEKRIQLTPDDLVVDIASNDGTLLSSYPSNLGLRLVGLDPVAHKFKEYYPEQVQYIPDFFSADLVKEKIGKQARVITSIAMFYDLEDPVGFVQQIYDTLTEDGIWMFEQSYLPAMIKNTSYDTICHEHLEYYGLKQIKWLMDKVGFKIIDVAFNDSNGGSFCLTVAKNKSNYSSNEALIKAIIQEEEDGGFNQLAVYEEFKMKVLRHKQDLLEFVAGLRKAGKKVFGYGASTKGNVILQYCGLTAADIPYIAEVNENKFGRVTPGTNIPIISEKEAKALRPHHFMVLPWHFKEHIINREAQYLSDGGNLIFPLPRLEVL